MVALFALGLASPVRAQRLERPEFSRTPKVLGAPTKLVLDDSHSIPTNYVKAQFPPVAGVTGYRLTRSADGGAEVVVFEGGYGWFAMIPGYGCTSGTNWCAWSDWKISSSVTYTYWVRAIFPGPVVGPPSPAATITTR
jgi:hypothetical protein